MGGFIQTKGTRLLSHFLSSQFGSGTYNAGSVNLNWMRQQPSAGGTAVPDLINDFGLLPRVGSGGALNPLFGSAQFLYDLSQAYVGLGPNGTDLFYPPLTNNPHALTLTASAITNNVSTLTFAFVPSWVRVGMIITDANGVIRANTVVQAPITTTSFAISQPTSGASNAGDVISFSDPNHPNFLARWNYYLVNELQTTVHDKIRQKIYLALIEPSIKFIRFDAIEDVIQDVDVSTEHDTLAGDTKLDPATKHMNIVLRTSRTKSPTPLDPQF